MIGERVRFLRKAKGLTLDKFGESLGVTKSSISKIEKNERPLTDQMAKAICRAYHVNEEWLKTGEGEMYTATTPLDEIMAALGDITFTIGNSDDPHSIEVAIFKQRLAAAILNLDDDGCDLVMDLLDRMGYIKEDD